MILLTSNSATQIEFRSFHEISWHCLIQNGNFTFLRRRIVKPDLMRIAIVLNISNLTWYASILFQERMRVILLRNSRLLKITLARPVFGGIWSRSSRIHRSFTVMDSRVPELCKRQLGTSEDITDQNNLFGTIRLTKSSGRTRIGQTAAHPIDVSKVLRQYECFRIKEF